MSTRTEQFVGKVLHDTFVIDEPIGEGGMGVVFAAHNAKTPSIRYAVKVLRPRDDDGVTTIDGVRFRREAQVLAALDHPSIVRPIHVDVTPEGEPYLVMEFVRGRTLRDKLAEAAKVDQHLSIGFVLAVLDGIAAAMDHAHGRGVVHRDLKPENVLVIESGRSVNVKVLDFGIAKIVQSDGRPAETITQEAEVAGTVSYMSPEQCRELRSAGRASDRFTLGVMAFEMLTLRRPFDGNNAASTICNIMLNPLPAVAPLREDVPAAVDAVLTKACAKDAAARFESAEAFVAAFGDAVGVESLPLVSDPNLAPSRVSSPRRSRDEQVESAPTMRASIEASSGPVTTSRDTRESAQRVWTGTATRAPFGAGAVAAIVLGSAALAAVGVVQWMKWRGGHAVVADAGVAVDARAGAASVAGEPCTGRAHERTANLFDEDVCIPGGEFTMGSSEGTGDADEHPAHQVRVRPFYMDRFEVTVARYRRCVQAGACDAAGLGNEGPYNDRGDYDPRATHFRASPLCTYREQASTNDARPINCVSFAQAVQVCRYEGRRLATEAEWERAARGLGDSPRVYPWGDRAPDCNHAAYGYGAGCGLAETVAVGTALAGATPEGVLDLAGNVFEWTGDWYSDVGYRDAPRENPTGATPDEARLHGGDASICRDGCRVTRGGAWNTPMGLASMLRAAHRTADAGNRRSVNIGVRCVR